MPEVYEFGGSLRMRDQSLRSSDSSKAVMTESIRQPIATFADTRTRSWPFHCCMASRTLARMAGGIVFLRTAQFEEVKSFYLDRVGMTVWVEQPDISILRFGNLLIGFCDHPAGEIEGVLTFFYDSREKVDAMYAKFKDVATTEPRENTKYRIYNFFGTDPEGRTIEFQCFLHELPPISDG